jgi:hypothetical protein
VTPVKRGLIHPAVMKRVTIGLALLLVVPIGLALLLVRPSAPPFRDVPAEPPKEEPRLQAWLALWLDYDDDGAVRLDFDGTARAAGGTRPSLSEWGLEPTLQLGDVQANPNLWTVHGTIGAMLHARPDADRFHHLQVDRIVLGPDDRLTLYLPFIDVDYREVTPHPDNREELIASPAQKPPSFLGLQYSGQHRSEVSLDIPFRPTRKEIALTITPLLGEMLAGRPAGFRVSGRVVFDDLRDFAEFTRYCQTDRASALSRYRNPALLWAVDAPPRDQYELPANSLYQDKAAYARVRLDLVTCQFQNHSGRVEATFAGRAYARDVKDFPEAWTEVGANEANRRIGGRLYELTIGDIKLGPGDVLTVSTPGTAIHTLEPPPAGLHWSSSEAAEIRYEGPRRRFPLTIVYAPTPELLAGQLPASARALTLSAEDALLQLLEPRQAPHTPLAWSLGAAAMALLVASRWLHNGRLRLGVRGTAWVLAAVVLLYGVRGVYGLLALAVLGYMCATRHAGRGTGHWARAAVAFLLIAAATYMDDIAEQRFSELSPLQPESTPFTPLILLWLGLALTTLLPSARQQHEPLSPCAGLAVALGLAAFTVFDVLQESLLAAGVLAAGLAYVAYRLPRAGKRMSCDRIVARFKQVWNGRFVPIGGALLVLFALQNGLQNTTGVLRPAFGVLDLPLLPALLLVSIVQGYVGIGALFLFLYPIVPFKAGYLKAITISTFLMLVFILGVGSDSQLVESLDDLIVGRFIYYAGIPLLIGLHFDIVHFMRSERARQKAEGKKPEPLTFRAAAPKFFGQLKISIGTVGSVAALVVPGLYARAMDDPLVTTYFDLLERLSGLPI